MSEGCHRCQDRDCCEDGASLLDALTQAKVAAACACATNYDRARVHEARAAWYEHCYGSWDDELSTEEEHHLAQVRLRHAALIDERRKGMKRR